MQIGRNVAIYSAGYVLMEWFLNCATEIRINMAPRNPRAERVSGRRGPSPIAVPILRPSDIVCAMMDSLAGPTAEFKYLGWSDDERSIEDRFEQWELSPKGVYSDIDYAIAFAIARHGKNKEGMEFLYQVSKWTQELIDVPKVWVGVNALADRLQIQTRMDGEEALEIMQKASGFKGMPLMELGQPWAERCKDWYGPIPEKTSP